MAESKSESSLPTPHGEPRRIMQTDLGPRGNCQSACLATLLGISLSEIPNWAALADGDGNKFAQMQRDWLAERGYGILTVVQWQALPWPPARGYFICGGVSPRGNRHAVIYKDGALWHDPHPEGLGIETVDDLDIIYPLAPFAESETMPTVKPAMLAALRDYKQADDHGVWCGVSRQAVDEAIEILAKLPEAK
jgi:hypothetical protein